MDKSRVRIQSMFAEIAGFYDLANSVLSLGLHSLWKKTLIKKVCESKPARVLDLCCGTGDIHLGLLKNSVSSIAVDFTMPMLEVLASRQKKMFFNKKQSILSADALHLPFRDGNFSCVTVSYGVRNFESLELGLKEILRVLEPKGKLFVLEFGQTPKGLFGNLIKFYESKIVPLIGRVIFSNATAYSYLSKSAEAFPSQQNFIQIAQSIGFTSGSYKSICFGASYIYQIQKQ